MEGIVKRWAGFLVECMRRLAITRKVSREIPRRKNVAK